jgi:hypothetical protein
MSFCPSWNHDPERRVVAEDGHITCAEHRDEEPYLDATLEDTRALAREIQKWEGDPSKRPDKARDIIEPAVRAFFDRALASVGLRCSSGYRQSGGRCEQVDVIVTLEDPEPDAWNADFSVCLRVEAVDLAVHMEVAYRADAGGLEKKVREDLDKLQRSIDQHGADGLPWTGLVLLGPAWRGDAVMAVLHHRFHGGRLEQVSLAGRQWWPFPDAVIAPRTLFKKHDLFETEEQARTLAGRRWPCYVTLNSLDREPPLCANVRETPLVDTFLRPLVVARAFLLHRIAILRSTASVDSSPWAPQEKAAILGPAYQVPDERPADWKIYTLQDIERERPQLFHAAGKNVLQCTVASTTCASGAPYVLIPGPSIV